MILEKANLLVRLPLSQHLVYTVHPPAHTKLLRTFIFTLTALHTLAGSSTKYAVLLSPILHISINVSVVEQVDIIRYVYLLGTGHTIITPRAGDEDHFFKLMINCFFQEPSFFCS